MPLPICPAPMTPNTFTSILNSSCTRFEVYSILFSGEQGSGFRGSGAQWVNNISAQEIFESFHLKPEP
jgi:hypothetical protein